MTTLVRVLLLLATLFALGACGDAGTTDRTKAQVRLVNASGGYPQLDLREDGTLRQGGVSYANSAEYVGVEPIPDDLAIHVAGSPTALATLQPTLAKNKHYTLLAYGRVGALGQLLLDDNQGEPDNDRTLVRVINAAPDAGALDIYVTATSEPLAPAVPLQAAAAYGAVGSWLAVTSGRWRLRVTAVGSKTDLRLDLPDVALGSKQRLTLVLTPAASGVLVNALVLDQEGAIARRDGAQARVRAVAGVAGGAAVSAAVGGVTVMNGVGSPAVGAYELVAAGDVTPQVAVGGASFDAPATTLAAGGDYTLLVHGTGGAPLASWVLDDNRLPTTSGTARVRLINGVAAASGPLAMTIDFLPLADGVGAGLASAYASTNAAPSARIAVTAAGTGTPLFLAPEQSIVDGTVYSVFVLGAADAAAGVVRKDR
jgi:hypothetical protein